jgi:hypothetical protein
LIFFPIQFISLNKSCKLSKTVSKIKGGATPHFTYNYQYQGHEITQTSNALMAVQVHCVDHLEMSNAEKFEFEVAPVGTIKVSPKSSRC